MAKINASLHKLQFANTTETAFCTLSGFTGRDVQLVAEPELKETEESIKDPTLNPVSNFEFRKNIKGLKGGELSFQTLLRGTGTAAGNSVPAVGVAATNIEPQLYKHALGAEVLGTGSTISSATNAFTCVVASSVGLGIGQVVLINGRAVRIANIATSTVTLRSALASNPSGVCVAGANYPLTTACLDTTLRARYQDASTRVYELMGLYPKISEISVEKGKMPLVKFSSKIGDWTNSGSGSLSVGDFDSSIVAPVVGASNCSVVLTAAGGTSAILLDTSSIKISINTEQELIDAINGTNGAIGYVRKPEITVEAELVVDWSNDLMAAYSAGTSYDLMITLGNVAGSTVAINMPLCYIADLPERTKRNDLLGYTIKLKGMSDLSLSTELLRAPLILTRL